TQYQGPISTDHPEFARVEAEVRERQRKLLSIGSSAKSSGERKSVDDFHRRLGTVLWDQCGMARNANGLEKALAIIPELREQFWKQAYVPGGADEVNPWLGKAGRVADFLEFAELMCHDALYRDESCGGHFREEHQTEEGEAVRDDENFAHVAVWEHQGVGTKPRLHKEQLEFESVMLTTR